MVSFRFGTATALVCIVCGLLGQTIRAGPPSADPEAEIRLLEQAEVRALLDRDVAVLSQLWSDSLMVNTALSAVLNGRDIVLEDIRQDGADYAAIERSIEHLYVDGDLVFVLGAERVRPFTRYGAVGQVTTRRFSHVWKLEPGIGWRLRLRHVSAVPSMPAPPRRQWLPIDHVRAERIR